MRKYIYTIKSQLLEKVVENYIDYVSNSYNEWRQEVVPTTNGMLINNGEGIKAMPLAEGIDNLPKPRYNTAKAHVMAIVDIMYRCHLNANEDNNGFFTVSSRFLKVASNNYRYILDTLFRMRIIDMSKSTVDGRKQRTVYSVINEEIFHLQKVVNLNNDTKKIVHSLEDYYEGVRQEKLKQFASMLSQQFVERYNQNLSKLKIVSKDAIDYVNATYTEEHDIPRKQSRLRTIHKIADNDYIKEIRSIDDNGRIYHIGTEIQRDIKQFTNIQYSVDCKNSHPFLLSYILIRYINNGKIDIDENYNDKDYHYILYHIIRYLKNNNGIYDHYMFSNFISKKLENSKLAKLKRAKITNYLERLSCVEDDVWRYIYDVVEGRLWDMFVEAFHKDRTTVKQQVFASVMYSYYSPRTHKNKEDETKWVAMFKTLYPTVFRLINEIKKSLHEQCRKAGAVEQLTRPHVVHVGAFRVEYTNKDSVILPLLLMRLESKIFTEILRKLFNKRITCFGIHDAVAVIHSKSPVNEIKSTMMDVYADYGLIPTLSVDRYSVE